MDIQQFFNLIQTFDSVQKKEFLMQLSQDMHDKMVDLEKCKDETQFVFSTLFLASCAANDTLEPEEYELYKFLMNELERTVPTYEELKSRVGGAGEDVEQVVHMVQSFDANLRDDIVMFCYTVCTADNVLDKKEYEFIQQLRAQK